MGSSPRGLVLEKGPIAPGLAQPSALPGYRPTPDTGNFVPGEATTCFLNVASVPRFGILEYHSSD